MIHRIPLFLSVLAFSGVGSVNGAAPLSLVPLPAKVVPGTGAFQLDAATTILATKPEEKHAAELLASWLRPPTGLALTIQENGGGKAIRFSLDPSLGSRLGHEGYLLKCDTAGVTIQAAEGAGLILGAQTFRQLLPPQAFRATMVEDDKGRHYLVTETMGEKALYLVDLGSRSCILLEQAAKDLKLETRDIEGSFNTLGNRGIPRKEATLGELKLGDHQLPDTVEVVVLPGTGTEEVDGVPVIGIMGCMMFEQFRSTLDFHTDQITFPAELITGKP